MYPSEYFKKIWERISFQVKITFFSSIIIGFFTHFFMITNLYPNHDTFLFHEGRSNITSGRWFTFFPSLLTDGYLLPWISGSLLIIFIAISACIVIKCLRINNNFYCILVSGLMVSFPTVTASLLYITGAYMPMLSLLFACLAIYITYNFRFGFCFGFIFVALSLGIYQAFFTIAAGLSIAVLIIDILRTNLSYKNIIIKAIKLFITLLLGIITYFIIVKLSLIITNLELSGYQGISGMGEIHISTLPGLIKKTYTSIIDFYIRDNYNAHIFNKITFPVLIIISSLLLFIIIIQKNIFKKEIHFLFLLLLIILYPLACNIIYIMAPNGSVHLLMRYGMVLLPIAVIVLMEIIEKEINQKEPLLFLIVKQGACWIITVILIFNIYNYGILANKVYTKAHIVYEQSYAYSVELITRIESADNYIKDIPILMIGKPGATISEFPEFNKLKITGSDNNLINKYSYMSFLHSFLGIKLNVKEADLTDIERYNLKKEIRKMPFYPNQGSIKKINDIIVVKFSSPPFMPKESLIPDSGLLITNSRDMLIQYLYDIFDLDITEDNNIFLHSGSTDPQLYISLQDAIEKPLMEPFIEITYTNIVPGTLQIYYDYGNNLSEEKTATLFIDTQLEEKIIKLPIAPWLDEEKLVGFRLDPPDGTEFTIINLKFPFLK